MTGKRVEITKLQPVDQMPPYDPVIAGALKAMQWGKATEHQQEVLIGWLIKDACGLGSISYRQGDSHATAFAEGRRFVGILIMHLIEITTKEVTRGD